MANKMDMKRFETLMALLVRMMEKGEEWGLEYDKEANKATLVTNRNSPIERRWCSWPCHSVRDYMQRYEFLHVAVVLKKIKMEETCDCEGDPQ